VLTRLVDSYLELRRSTGFRMKVQEYLLHNFASFAAERRETYIRTRTAVEWAAQAPSEGQRANRLGMLRVFARFARAEDAGHEVPAERVFSVRRVRYRPFILSSDQLHELLTCASKLPPAGSIRPWTFTTLFSLLAVTGLRISEALNLRLHDITEDGLVIRETKFQKSRLVPLHPTTMVGLKRYLDRRGAAKDDHLFVSLRGHGMRPSGVVTVFLRIVRAMGIHPGPGKPGPRIHDLRHGFAVRVLESCSGDRTVVDANMLALMTYMGHGQIDSTYWYLHATPHMLAQVAERSEEFGKGSQS
jgi:integrase/recombinase XerD